MKLLLSLFIIILLTACSTNGAEDQLQQTENEQAEETVNTNDETAANKSSAPLEPVEIIKDERVGIIPERIEIPSNHMYMVSKGLSSAITEQFPDQFNHTKAVTPAADLRSDLNYLFSEHAGLAAMTMQNGIEGSEDFEASAAALNNNTQDLTAAVTSIYGEEAGMQFEAMWTEHIGYFVDYVSATAEEDTAGREEALANLDMYKEEFSMFMDTATDGNLPAEALAEGLQMHVQQLIGAFDAYSAADYQVAYEQTREAYHHMFMTSKGLSGAIVKQMPDQFMMEMPAEMPNTAMAPPADNNNTLIISIFASIVLLSAAVITLRIRNQKN